MASAFEEIEKGKEPQHPHDAGRQKKHRCEKKITTLLRGELRRRGIKTLKTAAQFLGISTDLARRILHRDHIPKDKTLLKIARALCIDPSTLIVAAHRQKLPRETREFLLAPEPPRDSNWERKRRWPLSQEQCDYLGVIMKPEEIQFIRKYRQFAVEEKISTIGYLNYHFVTNRVYQPITEDDVADSADDNDSELMKDNGPTSSAA